MHDDLFDAVAARPGREGARKNRRLYELGPCTNNRHDLHYGTIFHSGLARSVHMTPLGTYRTSIEESSTAWAA
jgi:hypothetical protein